MDQRSAGGRVLVWAQWTLLVVCLISSFGVLLLAALRANDLGAVFDPGLDRLGDPMDSLPEAPLVYGFVPGMFVAYFIYPVAFVTVFFGLGMVMHTWQVGDRETLRGLLKSTGAWVVLTAGALTPFGTQLHQWLLD
ncbi:hypothetical protein FB565_006560 [Actinoplanes lutulentus]|uniref:hypothetical protein n=1 Tax=Actinoplanes lutulentus TaxID=1287878 RepID=UPI000DB937C6|nr:hypothetical protein [Actinoplanes lutulentus]MBB2946792.1 hypothetical protein [Actinoplanes lutulentus]